MLNNNKKNSYIGKYNYLNKQQNNRENKNIIRWNKISKLRV